MTRKYHEQKELKAFEGKSASKSIYGLFNPQPSKQEGYFGDLDENNEPNQNKIENVPNYDINDTEQFPCLK